MDQLLECCILDSIYSQEAKTILLYLCKSTSVTLSEISLETKLEINQIQQELIILINDLLVEFEIIEEEVIYKLVHENILLMIKTPLYLQHIRNLYDDDFYNVVLYVFSRKYSTISSCVENLATKGLKKENIEKAFYELINSRYFKKLFKPGLKDKKPIEKPQETKKIIKKAKKKQKKNQEKIELKLSREDSLKYEPGTTNEYEYTINEPKFINMLRAQQIYDALNDKFGQEIASIFIILFKQCPYDEGSDTIKRKFSFVQINNLFAETKKLPNNMVGEGLKILINSSYKFVVNYSDDNYSIDSKAVMNFIREKQIEKIIEGKYDKFALRVYRLIKIKDNLDEKEILSTCLLPFNTTQSILEKLHQEGLIDIVTEGKKGENLNSKFKVNLDKNMELMKNLLCKAIVALKTQSKKLEEYLNGSIILNESVSQDHLSKLQSMILDLAKSLMIFNDF